MELARANVVRSLATSASPAVLSSFGKDSLLLLWLVRQIRPDTPVIWFRTGQDERFAKSVIRDWQLTTFSWAPAAVYAVASNGRRALVHEYGLGESRFPVLSDLSAAGPCAARQFTERLPTLYLPFDRLLIGYKDSDAHWAKGEARLFGPDTQFGQAVVEAPIRHLTDAQVMGAIMDNHIPYQPVDDELALCTSCLATVPLTEFRSRFNLTEES
jgi:3'-phosphoadenosine 5'-phosphosulfate sulfotransferase (PAPS reductase)/FAD synthetase